MIRVLVAEDQDMIRGALVALLGLEPDVDVVAELRRGDDVLPVARELGPDVAVLDIDMPGADGLMVARSLHDELPHVRTLILTGLDQPGHMLEALQSHVRGFVLKAAPATTLAHAVRRVAAGERVLDPDLVAAALETGANPLPPRETDVLGLAATGLTTDEIGRQLYLSPTTVRNYLSNAIAKVGGRNRIDAIETARRAGWLRSR
ncbi:response regulator transcription factor [Pseudonocardia sp. ICBG1142]|uniref:response regulator transcription factor n=1 Tax=Pseudonocardia sp. ICBG1142 TaxID=2846760 RepID=UPI001CF6ABF7|nr:response regulator transcription factor [Pseudonocardia sp. ICBG1142]